MRLSVTNPWYLPEAGPAGMGTAGRAGEGVRVFGTELMIIGVELRGYCCGPDIVSWVRAVTLGDRGEVKERSRKQDACRYKSPKRRMAAARPTLQVLAAATR